MVAINRSILTSRSNTLGHEDACELSELARTQADGATVVIDLQAACDASTSAFARLVLLRRELLSRGRDLRLTGLRDRAARLYEVNRLASVLPMA